jgi:threonine dehydratase
MSRVDASHVHEAAERLANRVHITPVFSSRALSELSSADVVVKAELFQRAGSFKVRGTLNRLLTEPPDSGVVTFSAGNHAQAVALAARELDLDALVVMPAGASAAKVAAARAYGARVDLESADSREAFARATEIAAAEGRLLIHPFDDPAIVAGHGTVGLELLNDVPDLDCVIVPTSGGGLISGVALAVKAERPDARVIAVQTEAMPSLKEALRAGHVVPIQPAPTVADALTAPFFGDVCFEVCRELVDDVVLVDEAAIGEALRFTYQRLKLAAEPGGVVGVAALLSGRLELRPGERAAIVVSGGNVAPEVAAGMLA